MSSVSRREFLRQAGMVGLGAASVGVLSACSTATPGTTTTGGPTTAPVTEITYWQAPIWRYGKDNETPVGAGSDEWINDAIQRFQTAYPNIKVNMELVPWDQWGQKTAAAFSTGEMPNVLYSGLSVDRVQAGILESVDDYVTQADLDNWLPGSQDALTYFGKIYGVPAFINPNMAAFSKTALEQHGGADILTAVGEDRGGLTFDMMMEYGQQFGDNSTRYFLGVPTDHGSVSYWGFGTWLRGWGVRLWDEEEERWIAAENPNAVKAFQWYVDAQNAGILMPNLPKWSDVDNFYWGLNAAMRFHWPSIQTELEVAQAAGQAPAEFEIMLAAHPHLEEVGPFASGLGPGAYTIGKTDDAAKREAAATFAKWLGTDDSNAVAWLVNGIFPATKSGAAVVSTHPMAQDPNRKWVLETYMQKFTPEKRGEGQNYTPSINPRTAQIVNQMSPAMWEYMMQNLQSLLLGQKTPEQMLQEMSDRINSALAA